MTRLGSPSSMPGAHPVDAGRTDVLQAFMTFRTDLERAALDQVVQLDIHRGAQQLGVDLIKNVTQVVQGSGIFRSVERVAWTMNRTLRPLRLTAQNRGGIRAMIARRLHILVQNLAA